MLRKHDLQIQKLKPETAVIRLVYGTLMSMCRWGLRNSIKLLYISLEENPRWLLFILLFFLVSNCDIHNGSHSGSNIICFTIFIDNLANKIHKNVMNSHTQKLAQRGGHISSAMKTDIAIFIDTHENNDGSKPKFMKYLTLISQRSISRSKWWPYLGTSTSCFWHLLPSSAHKAIFWGIVACITQKNSQSMLLFICCGVNRCLHFARNVVILSLGYISC